MAERFYPLHSLHLITRFIRQIFPLVDEELAIWQNAASQAHCPELATQALASLQHKKFHCQGGSIYGLCPEVDTPSFIRLVVALQTISDYLDNLCDRAGICDEQAFACLHQAMTDALSPNRAPADYYACYPFHQDAGYLSTLVTVCQKEVARLPSYPAVKEPLLHWARLYSQLQTYKHLSPAIREEKMLVWLAPLNTQFPQLSPWELAAATGSTLGMFALCAAASRPTLSRQEVATLQQAYFPWINGLHILLDYFIDRQEDRKNGDLNFLSYYASEAEILERLLFFLEKSYIGCGQTQHSLFLRTVIDGLLSLYLSDPKTHSPLEDAIKKSLLKKAGWYPRSLYRICCLLRWQKRL